MLFDEFILVSSLANHSEIRRKPEARKSAAIDKGGVTTPPPHFLPRAHPLKDQEDLLGQDVAIHLLSVVEESILDTCCEGCGRTRKKNRKNRRALLGLSRLGPSHACASPL